MNLLGSFYEIYITMHGSMNIKFDLILELFLKNREIKIRNFTVCFVFPISSYGFPHVNIPPFQCIFAAKRHFEIRTSSNRPLKIRTPMQTKA
jgi:hypothetical protein